jgi:hypothetical protein
MKYVVAVFAVAFAFAIVPQADAAKMKPYAKLTLQEKFERDLQCSAKANEAKLTLDKRAEYIKKCQG